MSDLFRAWSHFEPSSGPNILQGDEILLDPIISKKYTVANRSFKNFASRINFGERDKKLHLSLLPLPFAGSIRNAKVVLLCLNPGLHPGDYYTEMHIPEVREKKLATIRSEYQEKEFPNIFLDPNLSWHPGFNYWHKKFTGIIEEVAKQRQLSRRKSISLVSQSVAFIERIPYHSESFGLSKKIVDKLHSSRLVKEYVQNRLVPKAIDNHLTIIVTRQVKQWGLEESKNIILYNKNQARGASLSINNSGGQSILKRILECPDIATQK